MNQEIHQIPLFPGMDEALRRLSDQGTLLAVVSSNSKANVLRVLGPQNAALIAYLHCGISMFGKTS